MIKGLRPLLLVAHLRVRYVHGYLLAHLVVAGTSDRVLVVETTCAILIVWLLSCGRDQIRITELITRSVRASLLLHGQLRSILDSQPFHLGVHVSRRLLRLRVLKVILLAVQLANNRLICHGLLIRRCDLIHVILRLLLIDLRSRRILAIPPLIQIDFLNKLRV